MDLSKIKRAKFPKASRLEPGEKNMKRYMILLTLILGLTPASIYAGDYAELDFIGVSKDGKYMAFEQYGEQDGSGFAYSNIYFIDVEKNKYAAKPVELMPENEKAAIDAVRRQAKRSAAATLKKLGIIQGNRGKLVVARLLTDAAFTFDPYKDAGKTQTIGFHSLVGSMYKLGNYQLKLESFKVGKKDYLDLPVYKLSLTLKDSDKNTIKILQKDDSLPATRGNPVSYSVQNVYLYGNRIIVFINVFKSGFEGPDMRYMAVTGVYK
jgi:predicted secreted protein